MPIAYQQGERTPRRRKKPKVSTQAQVTRAINDFTKTYGPKAGAGPKSSGKITPAQARKTAAKVRRVEDRRKTEINARARTTRTPKRGVGLRPEMPGAALRTPAAQEYGQFLESRSSGLFGDVAKGALGVGKGIVGLVDVTTGVPSFIRHPSLENAGYTALAFTPLGPINKVRRIGTVAARAAMAGEDVGEITRAAIKSKGAGSRFVRLGDSSIQFYSSPSRITRYGQSLIDAASERLTGAVGRLRESESRAARGAGRALTPLSSRGRVPKQAAKRMRQEQRRAKAARSGEIDLIHDIGGGQKRLGREVERPERTAFFYEAQLPAELRGGAGLRAIKDDLKRELDSLTPEQIARDSIRPVALRNQITKLEKAIKSGRKYDERALDAANALMEDRLDILVRAGRLSPDTAAERTTLLTRQLMGEGTEGVERAGQQALFGRPNRGEIFVGHRAGDVRGGRRMGPGGVATGKTRAPQGVGQQNRLGLYKQGRLRTDPDVIVEDWQAAQTYEFNNLAKDELARMGEAIDPMVGPKEGYQIINPQGHKIPRSWRSRDVDNLPGEGFSDQEMVSDLQEYISNYMPTQEADIARAIQGMAEGNPLYRDLRQVPYDVIGRYFNQFVDPTLIQIHPALKAPGVVGKGVDFGNDALYMSLIYSNPGYIPANLVGNLAFNVAHEGVFAPINLLRAGQLLAKGPKTLRRQVLAEMGQGPTTAVASSILKRPSRIIARIPDDGPRVAAFLHEAARRGVISSVKPVLTQRDYQKLAGLFRPQNRAVLNDVKDRAVEAMVNFERLGPKERAIFKRMLFVWPWIRGATAYPFRFALDHPVRSALMGGAAYGYTQREGMPFEENMPPWLQGAVRVGEKTIDGESYPSIINTGPISPIATALESIQSLAARPGARTAYEFLNPGLRAAAYAANKQSPYGRTVGSYGEAAQQNLERLAPNFGLAQDLISPPSEPGMYPEDVTRAGRLKRAARVLPYAINPEATLDAAIREGIAPPRPPEPLSYQVKRDWALKAPARLVPPRAKADVRRWARGEEMYRAARVRLADQLGLMRDSDSDTPSVSKLNDRQTYALKLAVLRKLRPELHIPANAKNEYRRVWELGDDKTIEDMKEWINARLNFSDKWDVSIPYIIEKLQEQSGG